jgi:hypothetical protein
MAHGISRSHDPLSSAMRRGLSHRPGRVSRRVGGPEVPILLDASVLATSGND